MDEWSKRFLESTRGQIVKRLRRKEATVKDLAEALELTGNAIRAQLTKLERDGLVRRTGKRSGVRKPETLYALTEEAERLFPKSYSLLFNVLLDVLQAHHSPERAEKMLREVGERIAARQSATEGMPDVRESAEEALALLGEMGGLAELEEQESGFRIQSYRCPLATAVAHHPEVCGLVETLLSNLIGVPVREQCEREGRPTCAFAIPLPEA